MEVTTSQLADAFGEGRGLADNRSVALSEANGGIKEGAGLEKTLPPSLSGKEQLAPPQAQSSTTVASELQDPLPMVVVEESSQALRALCDRMVRIPLRLALSHGFKLFHPRLPTQAA
ncbi:hypothetical protein NDU88_006633 [Pleurodeles waltl]|uniref:Uncharacterized protein n=1 Tax=Pleurodeles waltl TaxID=8319 RepID=A0AAV7SQ09_PLEWA|nr:hypothetical protein NDU88_006633 [Pleurodeles waltl]